MRIVNGIKVAFIEYETYFESLLTPSMVSTARQTGAEFVFLLAEGVKEDHMTDSEIEALIELAKAQRETKQ